jgi:hypothetical protein
MISENRIIGGHPFGCGIRDAHINADILKFTMAELRATALIFRYIDRALGTGAPFLLGTGQTGMPMPGHDGHHIFLTLFPDALILGNHPHAIGRFSCTGTHQFTLTRDLNQTDPAAFSELPGPGIIDFMFAVVVPAGTSSGCPSMVILRVLIFTNLCFQASVYLFLDLGIQCSANVILV